MNDFASIAAVDRHLLPPLPEGPQPLEVDKDNVAISDLAALPIMDYERQREGAAKELGIRRGVLDKLVEKERPAGMSPADEASPFAEMEPWPDPVDGTSVVNDLICAIRRFCVLPEHSDIVMAFWVLHAHAHDAADISPTLAFTSPEKRCGKTTALSIVSALVPSPMHAVNISPAVMFRVVETYKPTVLIDEGDTFLADNDELRGILNGGHNRLTAYVWRSVGDDHEPRQFRVWAPKCIAMIGSLQDTLEDRSFVVSLRRKQAGETVERFRADRFRDFEPLARQAARWAADNFDHLRKLDPPMPIELNDRAQDNARALVAIADCIGGEWPARFRNALIGLAAQRDDEPQSAGVLLLRDVDEILETRSGEKIGSTSLCEALCGLEDSPWAEWRRGSPITTRGVAKQLKPFGITPQRDRHGSFYRTSDFADALNRYLPGTPELNATSATSATLSTSVIENPHEINAVALDDTCGTCGGVAECKYHNPPSSATPGKWEDTV